MLILLSTVLYIHSLSYIFNLGRNGLHSHFDCILYYLEGLIIITGGIYQVLFFKFLNSLMCYHYSHSPANSKLTPSFNRHLCKWMKISSESRS